MILALGLALLVIQDPPDILENRLLPLLTVSEGRAEDRFGETIAQVGDVNRDGFSDFAVGARGFHGKGGPMSGAVYLYSGLDGRRIGFFEGEGAFDRFGRPRQSATSDAVRAATSSSARSVSTVSRSRRPSPL